VVATVALVAAAGYWSVRPLLRTGTGYVAHSNCAVTHLAGRDDPASDLPPNPLVPFLVSQAGEASATVTVLGALAWQTAWYSPGLGCTLGSGPVDAQEPTPVEPATLEVAPDPALDGALAAAFGDDLDAQARDELGTRAVVVLRDGEVVAERYADGFDADTRQLGWSMTKSVTNLMVGRIIHDGDTTLTLDSDHLRGEWEGDARAGITVDDLLRMTGGLAWDETYDLGTPITQMLYGEPDMGAFVASQPATHEPGTFQQYSSGSTTLLCSVLAGSVTGDGPLLPHDVLFEPLGLSTAVLEPDAVGTPVCGSYLWATPRDWALIGQFALDDGVVDGVRLLPDGWMASSTTVEEVAETDSPNLAASWWVNELPDGTLMNPELPADTYWASGHDGQRVYVVPSEDLVVVRLGFSPSADDIRADQLVADVVSAS